MKRIVLATVAVIALAFSAQAQDVRFGATAGYLNARASVKADGLSISASESGFYVGAVADFMVSESFSVQPELLFASIDESNGLLLPILGKFAISEKFNFQVGPQLVFSLEDTPEDFSSVEFDIAGGIGYDINEDFFIEARYSFQINNSYTGSEDVKVRGNYLTIGMGYKFL
ncbi:PorT family protein [Flagellimonas taeanensis]|uniref:porin family protein n=1 Tax=Flavobacteriaceae TaxID=49546 RepID=UPI000E69893F|nr:MULTISPECIES: porin family protein [Allomuricauda]MDC6386897.1 porin family protein [Muricauda sp. SK9]RIV50602.1 PorT family protein [Allomuricauda taeanensis]